MTSHNPDPIDLSVANLSRSVGKAPNKTSMSRAGRVVLFTGPSGAGKTTIGEAWAGSRDFHTAFIDHDLLRFVMRSGYVSRRAARQDESLLEERDRQWLLAAAVCEAMVQTYVSSGVDVAVSAFRPPGEWKGCWKSLDTLNPLVIVLLPSLDVMLARDETREGRMRVGEDSVRRGVEYEWESWTDSGAVLIENSELSVDEVVAEVERLYLARWG